VKEKLRDMQLECRSHAYEHGVDLPSADAWRWPG
jgi:xylulose-5-phosphate/fructose-6-phosphate phosphoketolase